MPESGLEVTLVNESLDWGKAADEWGIPNRLTV